MAEARRRQVIALVLSGIFPGLGQLYNRQWGKGSAALVAGVILSWRLARAVPADLAAPPPLGADLLVALALLLAVWVWSVIDAWRVAGR